jgi:hypothetical protein
MDLLLWFYQWFLSVGMLPRARRAKEFSPQNWSGPVSVGWERFGSRKFDCMTWYFGMERLANPGIIAIDAS